VRKLSLILLVCLPAACLSTGCDRSSKPQSTAPANTRVNPGPNPTTGDPGPNNTVNGPVTLQGTLVAKSDCVELDGSAANEAPSKFQLVFDAETVRTKGDVVVLSGKDGDRTVGPRDTIYVAGRRGAGSGPCGEIFEVEKVVAVTPAG
jgi:hypothetical protein